MIRNLAAALGFVLVVTAVFALIGSFGSAGEEAAAPDGAPAEEAEPAPEDDTDPPVPEDRGFEVPADDDDAQEPPDAEEDADPVDGPAEISVQVLDGYQQDGGAAASAVTEELRAAGYNVVAENPAIAYEITTVLWNPGFEAQAQEVADVLGAAEVREQPGNLSAQVEVHVVVGADRA